LPGRSREAERPVGPEPRIRPETPRGAGRRNHFRAARLQTGRHGVDRVPPLLSPGDRSPIRTPRLLPPGRLRQLAHLLDDRVAVPPLADDDPPAHVPGADRTGLL